MFKKFVLNHISPLKDIFLCERLFYISLFKSSGSFAVYVKMNRMYFNSIETVSYMLSNVKVNIFSNKAILH